MHPALSVRNKITHVTRLSASRDAGSAPRAVLTHRCAKATARARRGGRRLLPVRSRSLSSLCAALSLPIVAFRERNFQDGYNLVGERETVPISTLLSAHPYTPRSKRRIARGASSSSRLAPPLPRAWQRARDGDPWALVLRLLAHVHLARAGQRAGEHGVRDVAREDPKVARARFDREEGVIRRPRCELCLE